MSKRYFKSTIKNNDFSKTFYIEQDDSLNYKKVVDENGIYSQLKDNEIILNECTWLDLPEEAKLAFNPTTESVKKIDWNSIRIQMAENFMANMLNADETFRTKIVADLLYKELAIFSVKCADALIEELKK